MFFFAKHWQHNPRRTHVVSTLSNVDPRQNATPPSLGPSALHGPRSRWLDRIFALLLLHLPVSRTRFSQQCTSKARWKTWSPSDKGGAILAFSQEPQHIGNGVVSLSTFCSSACKRRVLGSTGQRFRSCCSKAHSAQVGKPRETTSTVYDTTSREVAQVHRWVACRVECHMFTNCSFKNVPFSAARKNVDVAKASPNTALHMYELEENNLVGNCQLACGFHESCNLQRPTEHEWFQR